ncbi:MAG: branched-chain amino acid ABC transporter permease [Chloroflexota bacterium]
MSQAENRNPEIQHEIQGTKLLGAQVHASWPLLKWGGLLLVILALLAAPMFASRYILFVLSLWAVTTIAAQGLNLTMGYAGKISLAQAAFMGIGAYVSVLLVKEAGVNFWWSMLIATLVCMLIGAGIGFPALRVDGHYLAFVTLGFGELVYLVVRNEDQWTGGPMGILNIARPNFFGISLFSSTNFYYFTLVMLALSSLFVWYMVRSPWGRAFKALRDNPNRAESLGISTTAYTLLAFAIGSGLGGVAGVLTAPLIEFIDPQSFQLIRSLEFLLMVMVGGRGTLAGPFIGAFFAKVLPEWLRFANDYYLIFFSIVVMVFIIFFPNGIAGFGPTLRKRFFERNYIGNSTGENTTGENTTGGDVS